MFPNPNEIGWTPAGPGKVEPLPGHPPIEDSKKITVWRCSDGELWAEEARSPPMSVQVLQHLAVFLATNGYLVAMVSPTRTENVLVSRNKYLNYQLLPLPEDPKGKWLLSQGKK
jgi:hypothetical protein